MIRNRSSLILKLFVVAFSLAAIITLFLTWVRIEIPIIGNVYNISGFQATGFIPIVLLALTTILFIIYSFISIKRIVSITTASINVIAMILIPIGLSKVKEQDTYIKFIDNISWFDLLMGTDLHSLANAAIKYEGIVFITLTLILISIVLSVFINDKY